MCLRQHVYAGPKRLILTSFGYANPLSSYELARNYVFFVLGPPPDLFRCFAEPAVAFVAGSSSFDVQCPRSIHFMES